MNSSPLIFFLIPKLPSADMKGVGGGELSNMMLISSIAKKFNVIVLPMLFSSNNYTFDKHIKVIKPHYKLSGRIGYFLEKYVFYYRRLYKLASKHRPDKIISTRSTVFSAYTLKSIFKCELEVIVRAYEDFTNRKKFDPYSKVSFFRKFERYLFRKKIKDVYKNVDRFITNSKFMSHAIQSDLGIPINYLVIYPDISLPRIKPKFEKVKKIGFINRGKKKGDEIVVELSKKNPLIQFLIFGDNLSTSQNNIVNMGYFNVRSEIFKLIDIILVPSLWNEPYGRIASEAIWSGKMVLASKKGGLLEAAPDNFFLVDSILVEEWNKRLKIIINNNKLVDISILKAQNILSSYNLSYY